MAALAVAGRRLILACLCVSMGLFAHGAQLHLRGPTRRRTGFWPGRAALSRPAISGRRGSHRARACAVRPARPFSPQFDRKRRRDSQVRAAAVHAVDAALYSSSLVRRHTDRALHTQPGTELRPTSGECHLTLRAVYFGPGWASALGMAVGGVRECAALRVPVGNHPGHGALGRYGSAEHLAGMRAAAASLGADPEDALAAACLRLGRPLPALSAYSLGQIADAVTSPVIDNLWFRAGLAVMRTSDETN